MRPIAPAEFRGAMAGPCGVRFLRIPSHNSHKWTKRYQFYRLDRVLTGGGRGREIVNIKKVKVSLSDF